MSEPKRRRLPNKGETKSEQDYIRLTHLERIRIADSILSHVVQANDPANIPEHEYLTVMRTVGAWIERLER